LRILHSKESKDSKAVEGTVSFRRRRTRRNTRSPSNFDPSKYQDSSASTVFDPFDSFE